MLSKMKPIYFSVKEKFANIARVKDSLKFTGMYSIGKKKVIFCSILFVFYAFMNNEVDQFHFDVLQFLF
jgi:hypothetical protein